MSTLHVRNVPTELYERLRARARQKGHSINSESIEILTSSPELAKPMTWQEALARSDEMRARYKLPAGSPSSVELIREDRASH